jgi:hyperosmotically inducible protein
MYRYYVAALVSMTLTVSAAVAQGPLQRVGQALDQAGKNIRADIENAVNRGQVAAQEQSLIVRVSERINWDKQLVNSAIQMTMSADGTIQLRGSVPNTAAKARAVDLAANTIGVTRVVDELAVVSTSKVIEAKPGVIESTPAATVPNPPQPKVDEKP